MPLYEFHCDACGKAFEELFRSMSERRRPACPKCGSRNVHKKFSTFALGGTERGPASPFGLRRGKQGAGAGGGCATCSSGSCATCGG
ncbi:MAG: zinc ribbon domain-containing protein [Phycisphaerae bacterium]